MYLFKKKFDFFFSFPPPPPSAAPDQKPKTPAQDHFRSSLSLGVFSWNFPPDPPPPRTPLRPLSSCRARELQTFTFKGPRASNTTKIPREDPQRERKKRKWGRERKKKREILGLPPSAPRPPLLRASPFGRRPSGLPLFRGLGPYVPHYIILLIFFFYVHF